MGARGRNREPSEAATARMLHRFGPHLGPLVEGLGASVVSASRVGGAGSFDASHGAFRLALSDGRGVKARILADVEKAERVQSIIDSLDHPALPRVLARNGPALLLEWIDGVPLVEEDDDSPTLHREAGSLLGQLHARGSSATIARYQDARASLVDASRLEDDLSTLMRLGLLADEIAESARQRARSPAASAVEEGVVHRDFCAENLIRSRDRLFVVDNETFAVGALDYDLARTWYRWPMDRAAFEEFLCGYSESRSYAFFSDHFAFWTIGVLAASAVYRAGLSIAGARVPLERLHRLVVGLDAGREPLDCALPEA